MRGVSVLHVHRHLHHSQHRDTAAAPEVAPDENRGEDEEEDVEDGRVVPGDRRLDDLRVSLGRDEAEALEDELDDQRRRRPSSA